MYGVPQSDIVRSPGYGVRLTLEYLIPTGLSFYSVKWVNNSIYFQG